MKSILSKFQLAISNFASTAISACSLAATLENHRKDATARQSHTPVLGLTFTVGDHKKIKCHSHLNGFHLSRFYSYTELPLTIAWGGITFHYFVGYYNKILHLGILLCWIYHRREITSLIKKIKDP